jgi:hypothetical protein
VDLCPRLLCVVASGRRFSARDFHPGDHYKIFGGGGRMPRRRRVVVGLRWFRWDDYDYRGEGIKRLWRRRRGTIGGIFRGWSWRGRLRRRGWGGWLFVIWDGGWVVGGRRDSEGCCCCCLVWGCCHRLRRGLGLARSRGCRRMLRREGSMGRISSMMMRMILDTSA